MSTLPFDTPEMLAEKQANRDRLLGALTLRPLEHERISSFMDIRIIDDLEPEKRPRDASKLGNMIRRVWTTQQPLGIRDQNDTLMAVVISAETWEKAYPLLKEAGLIGTVGTQES